MSTDAPFNIEPSSSESSVSELRNILNNPGWRLGYVEINTQTQKEELAALEKETAQKARSLAVDKLKQQTGGALSKEDFQLRVPELAKIEAEAIKQNEVEAYNKLKLNLETATEAKQAEISRLEEELLQRQNDPNLIQAFEVWGRSPNHALDRGSDGRGYNAGVIHYFEYSAYKDKGGNKNGPITLDGFINWSNRIKTIVENPDSPSIKEAVRLEDSTGKQALHTLVDGGLYIVSYPESNGATNVVTVIPGQNESTIKKSVDFETQTSPEQKGVKRLNHLGDGVHQVQTVRTPTTISSI